MDAEEKDVVITYETLFEMLRIEKTREELQKLDDAFFEDVLVYLSRKKNTFENSESQSALFETDEKEKTRLELENIKKILKDLYDRREKKILTMALNKARTGVSVVNTANMLPSEIMLFDAMNTTLLEFRKNILFKLVCGDCPAVSTLPDTVISKLNRSLVENELHSFAMSEGDEDEGGRAVQEAPGSQPEENPVLRGSAEAGEENQSYGQDPDIDPAMGADIEPDTLPDDVLAAPDPARAFSEEPKELKTSPYSGESASAFKKVRFLAPIEEIVGPDLQIYGPYDAGAVISLPRELARVLLEKEQAEEA
ncbi:hypothetical protein KY362_01115 [Candidatus Woesearchaeota archaeon]|nr:hypothetical protein [Candidatus Woesearchaeota archaeon]